MRQRTSLFFVLPKSLQHKKEVEDAGEKDSYL